MVFFSAFAEAALVPIAITAEVTEVLGDPDLLEGRVNVGDLITGVYIYDSSTPDSHPFEHWGVYEHHAPPYGITLTVGGFVFMTDPGNVDFLVEIANNIIGVVVDYDLYRLESHNNLPFSNGVLVNEISLELRDYTATALSSEALPTTAPVLDDWYYRDIRIYAGFLSNGWQASYTFYGHLTSAVLIPEPATIILLGLGGLALLRRRRV